MSGFCSLNHGKPSIICCLPNLVTSNLVHLVLLLMTRLRITKEVIFPFLFGVPSTFRAIKGCSSFWVLMILFVSSHICTGIDNELDCIFSAVIQYMSSMGEIDVGTIILFKNPLSQLRQGILLSLLAPFEQLHFRYGPWVPSDSFSLTWWGMECKMGERSTWK